MPKDTNSNLPTVISSSIILNTFVKAAESASEKLGDGYYSVVRKEMFRNEAAVYKVAPKTVGDPLDTSQSIVDSEAPIWSMDLSESALEKASIFSKNPAQYFFLTKNGAVSYLKHLEDSIVKLILKSAENAIKETK